MAKFKNKKAVVSKRKIETSAPALQSKQRAIKESHAECLQEFARLKRRTQEMEISHAQAIASIQEQEHAAQENFKADQARLRLEAAGMAANHVNPAGYFAPETQEAEPAPQRKKMNLLVFIIQAILFGGGIVVVGILLLITRKFHQRDVSSGQIYSHRPIMGQIGLNPANFL